MSNRIATQSDVKGGVITFLELSVDPASISAGANGTTAITTSSDDSIVSTDKVLFYNVEGLADGLVVVDVTVTNDAEITLNLLNTTGSAIDEAGCTVRVGVLQGLA